jgi:hypothetical protein
MTLFWHGHFTSGLREVKRAGLMHEQNGFLRTHALSDFRTLLRGISRDAAMLVYLDNGKNVKGRPNENYARELMELFTMGEGHYTEQDVREAARAFTGWASGPRGFVVQASRHDDGEKTFLGRTGQFDGDDIIEIILEQPATAEYLARKLWAFFVESEPDETIVQRLAETIRLTDYDLREAMRTILSSDAFYGPRARFALVKSPVELMAGTLRRLAIPPGDLRAANDVLRQMGQELFQPPNVKGWDGGRAWISTNTLFARYNAMSGVIRGTGNDSRRFAMQERFGARLASLGIGTADDDEGQAMPARPLARGMAAEGKAAFAGLTEEKMIELAEAVEGLDERARARLREVQLPPQYSGPQPAYDPLPVIQRHQLATPAMIVNHYVDRLLQMPIPDDRRLVLVQVLSGQDPTFDPTAPAVLERVRGVVLLIMSMPEYQLN